MLRRTELKRNTPLQRKPMKRKRRKGDKPELRYEYASRHQSCALTWARAGQFAVVLDTHHLVAGSGRIDDVRNLLVLSRESHNHYHFGGWLGDDGKQRDNLTPGHLMWCKREADIENYDEAYIAELLGRQQLPDRWLPVRPPAWVFELRKRNRMGWIDMSEIRFFVPGGAQPAGSKKPFAYKSGKLGVRDDNDKSADWKTIVALTAHQYRPDKLLTGPIELTLTFHRPRNAGHFGSGKNAGVVKASAPSRPVVRPDVLKLARGVEDALTKVVWLDDAQIVDEHLHKVFSDTPGVEILIREL